MIELITELNTEGIGSFFVPKFPTDETIDYIIEIKTDNIDAHMTFHVKGNPAGYLDSVGAFHLKIDTIKGPDGKKLDLKSISKSPIFRFTPIFTTDNRKSGEVLFRLTTIEPHGLLFSKKKPLGTDSLVKYAGEFRDTIRLPLTDEVLTDIYKIIDIIQKFIFSFNTGASAAEVGGGGGAGGGGAGGGGGGLTKCTSA